MDYAAARKHMVDSQVRVNDVTDRSIQAAMLNAPRERLLPADKAYMAYAEIEAPIAGHRRLMLARDVSKLLMALGPRSGETALAIAAPYAGLVLAHMGLEVTAQEADAEVLQTVSDALVEAGAQVVQQALNAPPVGPFDIIVSEGAIPDRPEAWIGSLTVGGRLAVVERDGPTGKATLYVKGEHGVSRRVLFDAAPSHLAELARSTDFAL